MGWHGQPLLLSEWCKAEESLNAAKRMSDSSIQYDLKSIALIAKQAYFVSSSISFIIFILKSHKDLDFWGCLVRLMLNQTF